jgi:hypothetical protein
LKGGDFPVFVIKGHVSKDDLAMCCKQPKKLVKQKKYALTIIFSKPYKIIIL